MIASDELRWLRAGADGLPVIEREPNPRRIENERFPLWPWAGGFALAVGAITYLVWLNWRRWVCG